MKKDFELTTSHQKILLTVSYLNKEQHYPLSEGIYLILIGDISEEILAFKDCPTYGTLISFNSKKVSRYVLMLCRYGYLTKKFDRNTNELYLAITPKGEMEVSKYFKKFKGSLKKKSPKSKPTIIKIVE